MIECEKCKAQSSLRVVLLKNQPSLVCTKLFTSSSTDRQGCSCNAFHLETVSPVMMGFHGPMTIFSWFETCRNPTRCLWEDRACSPMHRTRYWTKERRESGPQLWFLPMQCTNSVITIDLCVSLVLRFTDKCEAWLCRLTILWWTLAINFSSSSWYINTTLMFLPSFLSAELTLEHPPGHGKSRIKCRDLTCTVG